MRAVLSVFSVCLAVFISLSVSAQPLVVKSAYQEGRHYRVLPQALPTDDPSKIEIREIFSYACGHCFQFQPVLKKWSLLERQDVDYVPMPAIFNDGMKAHGQLYYTLKSMNMVEKFQQPVFDAIHLDKKRLNKEPAIRAFLVREGVDEETFNQTFNSESVLNQVKQAAGLTRQYRIGGTPELVINGQYVIGARAVGGHNNMLRVAEQLVDQIRLERIYGKTQ